MTLTLGGRASYYNGTAEWYVEPRFSALVAITANLRLKGAYGRYHQFVNRVVNENVTEGSRDFWLLADGDLVDVQGSTHYVAGAAYEQGDFLFDVEAYHKELDGLSEFSLRFRRTGLETEQLFFNGTGTARGIEFLAQKRVGRLTGWLTYTIADVEHRFPGLNDGDPFPALHDQRHEFKAVSAAQLGRWNVSATWTYGSGKPYTAPEAEFSIELLDGETQNFIHVGEKNSLRLPAYHRLDVAAQYHFTLGGFRGDIGVSVFNLYNRTNVWYREFDLTTSPALVTDVSYLGVTPNISIRMEY